MNTNKTNPNMYNQSAEKVMATLEFLANTNEPMRLVDISKGLHMNASTTLRFINTLVLLGYIAQEESSSKYFLTYKLCSISNKIYTNSSIREIVSPYLKRLANQIQESACLAIEQNKQVVYIDVAEGPNQMVQSMNRIGNIAPLHSTGIGKILLLNYSEKEIDQLILEKGLVKLTENTIVDKASLLNELCLIKDRGYAFDNEECEIGARCISFPIYDFTNKIVAGFSITGPTHRLCDSFIENHLPLLKQTSIEISKKLGAEII